MYIVNIVDVLELVAGTEELKKAVANQCVAHVLLMCY